MGPHGKGVRNTNGDILRDFLESTSLYLANTHFNHRPMQIATWHGGRPSAAAERRGDDYRRHQPGLHNQLDYIAVPKRMLPLFTDARAFLPHNQVHRTDHSLVVATVRIHSIYRLKNSREQKRLSGKTVRWWKTWMPGENSNKSLVDKSGSCERKRRRQSSRRHRDMIK